MLVPNLIQLSLWVQSTHPCGVRRLSIQIHDLLIGFNPRTRVGCDAVSPDGEPILRKLQSTHPCGVRRLVRRRKHDHTHASIHAPVWGATELVLEFVDLRLLQSTHPCGVRPDHPFITQFIDMLQSTHPCGVRPTPLTTKSVASLLQSTHPCGVRRATMSEISAVEPLQSTHPCGVRRGVAVYCRFTGVLQSTHPCGVRLGEDGVLPRTHRLQSTHPCGVRHRAVRDNMRPRRASIHAPVWGATSGSPSPRARSWSFNPRTRVGCDYRSSLCG